MSASIGREVGQLLWTARVGPRRFSSVSALGRVGVPYSRLDVCCILSFVSHIPQFRQAYFLGFVTDAGPIWSMAGKS